MELFNTLEKYHKIVKEEDTFNYKYNPILNSRKNNRRRLSEIYNNNIKIRKLKILEKERIRKSINSVNESNNNKKLISDNSLLNKEPILEEKYFLSQIRKKKGLEQGNINKIKGYLTKSQCPFCQKELSPKEKDETTIEDMLTDPNNFKEIKSFFVFSTNNFPLINAKINGKFYSFKNKFNEEKENKKKLYKITYNNKKTDMESYLSKRKKIKKIKIVNREEINTKNLYMIEKPLLTSMRGKIYKNMQKRFKKPLRLIILDNIFHPINFSSSN